MYDLKDEITCFISGKQCELVLLTSKECPKILLYAALLVTTEMLEILFNYILRLQGIKSLATVS